jgi:hypothetical protein
VVRGQAVAGDLMTEIRLTNTIVMVHTADVSKGFKLNSIVVEVTTGRRPIRVRFAGPRATVMIEMPRAVGFRASAEVHEAMISVPPRRSRA